MEEKKYTVMSDDNGKIYVYMGENTYEYPPGFPEFLKFQSIQRVNDPHNWEVGELVSDSDIEFLTGSGWIRRRMEEKKYTVMSHPDGNLYIDTSGGEVLFAASWDSYKPIKHIIDPENWEVGEVVSVNDFYPAWTGSATRIARVL